MDKIKRKSYYTGYTQDLNKRYTLHRLGKGAKFTRGKELTLVYSELYTTRSDAMRRELEIKAMTKKQKIQLIQSGEVSNDTD